MKKTKSPPKPNAQITTAIARAREVGLTWKEIQILTGLSRSWLHDVAMSGTGHRDGLRSARAKA